MYGCVFFYAGFIEGFMKYHLYAFYGIITAFLPLKEPFGGLIFLEVLLDNVDVQVSRIVERKGANLIPPCTALPTDKPSPTL
jgi:hypothetical protein